MKYLLIVILLLSGCTQRQVKYYEYNEVTKVHREWEYKNNSLASKQEIDWLYLDLPSKGKLTFGPYRMDNDSIKGGYGPLRLDTGPTRGLESPKIKNR